MAVRLEGTIQRWVGLSTDIKPDHQTTVIPSGSSFLESDTGRIYRSTVNEWAIFPTGDGQSEILSGILAELVNVRRVLEYQAEVKASDLG